MPPMGTPHAIGVQNCMYWAINAFRPRLDVRVQMPFDAQGDSMPEPDVAIVTQSENRKSSHPASAELIIEVSNTTLIFDRALSVEYAAAGVPLYWIIDVKRRVMEVRSEVIDDPQSPTGKNYGNLRTLTENDIADTFDPNVRVAVKELLP